MRYVAICVCVLFAAACGGTNTSQEGAGGVPFLEGLEVSESAPIEVRCRTEIGTMTNSFETKEGFKEDYEKMHRGFQNAEKVSAGSLVFNADLAESCEILHDGRVLESWSRE